MKKRSEAERVELTAATRMSDPDFPGVLRQLGAGCRVSVNPDGTRYALQSRIETPDGERWAGRSFRSLSALVASHARHGGEVSELLAGLPEDPAEAKPELKAARSELLGRFTATDWRRSEYARVVGQDANMRLVVEPSGEVYRLQWISEHEYQASKAGAQPLWRTQAKSGRLSEIRQYMLDRVFEFETRFAEHGREAVAERVGRLLHGLPENACDGAWPVLPERPSGVRAGKR